MPERLHTVRLSDAELDRLLHWYEQGHYDPDDDDVHLAAYLQARRTPREASAKGVLLAACLPCTASGERAPVLIPVDDDGLNRMRAHLAEAHAPVGVFVAIDADADTATFDLRPA